MDDSIRRMNIWCLLFLFLVHFIIIFLCSIFYSIEKFDSKKYIPTNCQINQTFTEEIPCSLIKERFIPSKRNKLCKQIYYGIIYANNIFTYIDQLPTWFSPIDAENLRQTPMIFSGKILSKSMNLTCYYDHLTHMHIRWTKPSPQGFIQLILFSFISLSLIVIHCFYGYCSRRR